MAQEIFKLYIFFIKYFWSQNFYSFVHFFLCSNSKKLNNYLKKKLVMIKARMGLRRF
jgi:hypothetical protein